MPAKAIRRRCSSSIMSQVSERPISEKPIGDRPIGDRPDRVQFLLLERCDHARNMARFYVLAIEPTLFGEIALVREWGRLGTNGRRRLDLFADGDLALETLHRWLARKLRRGYTPKMQRPLAGPVTTGNG